MTTVQSLREVMAGVCTPVSVVTAMDGQRPHGTTVSAFSSLSLDPPMIMVALDRSSSLLQLISEGRYFGVNILGAAHADLAAAFARKGPDKFGGVSWELSDAAPRLSGAPGWVACVAARLVDGGDHVVIFGSVVRAEARDGDPLTYHRRAFGTQSVLQATNR